MSKDPKRVRQSINKAWLKVKPNRSAIDGFKSHLIQLIDRIDENKYEEFSFLSEEFLENFLKEYRKIELNEKNCN